MGKRKVNVGGQDFMAEEVEFEPEGAEKWNTYILHDGSTLKVKAILADVMRLDGQFSPNGDPVYTVNASIVVSTNSPDNLRKKN
jgi:hypothetical protein